MPPKKRPSPKILNGANQLNKAPRQLLSKARLQNLRKRLIQRPNEQISKGTRMEEKKNLGIELLPAESRVLRKMVPNFSHSLSSLILRSH